MATISDLIEQFIKSLMGESDTISISRNELAQYFDCAPSQINYVLATRFSFEHGFVIESKRGGGGSIRLMKISPSYQELLKRLDEYTTKEGLTYQKSRSANQKTLRRRHNQPKGSRDNQIGDKRQGADSAYRLQRYFAVQYFKINIGRHIQGGKLNAMRKLQKTGRHTQCIYTQWGYQSPIFMLGMQLSNHKAKNGHGLRQRILDDFGDIFNDLSDIFDQLFGAERNAHSVPSLKCSRCGTTSDEFLNTAFVGCAQCYKAFEPIMESVIKKCQKDNIHTGKGPNGVAKTYISLQRLNAELKKPFRTKV